MYIASKLLCTYAESHPSSWDLLNKISYVCAKNTILSRSSCYVFYNTTSAVIASTILAIIVAKQQPRFKHVVVRDFPLLHPSFTYQSPAHGFTYSPEKCSHTMALAPSHCTTMNPILYQSCARIFIIMYR